MPNGETLGLIIVAVLAVELAAELADPIPAYFPPYWDVARLNKRARKNPYYRG